MKGAFSMGKDFIFKEEITKYEIGNRRSPECRQEHSF